jgi:S-adenosyl-L-methionine hydrolase (adenosine-forming)
MTLSLSSHRGCITFLTDFGSRDTYVGQMKGVALGINPHLHLIDLTHEIPPQDILRAAYIWNDAIAAFPPETIHVGVVDPGVGSERRIVAAEIGDFRFVCPDNGLLTVILQRLPLHRAVYLDRSDWWRGKVSKTFHGRDVMTPVAAAWSTGLDLSEFGAPARDVLMTLPIASVLPGKTSFCGQVIDVDRFGNLITNIDVQSIPPETTAIHVDVGGFRIDGLSSCYADVKRGDAIALSGSAGRLEIAIREGNAAEELQVECGRRVVVRWTGKGV